MKLEIPPETVLTIRDLIREAANPPQQPNRKHRLRASYTVIGTVMYLHLWCDDCVTPDCKP